MERSRLRRCPGWRYALMDLILEELVKESSIKRTIGKHRELISPKV
jgi:hypothetical protein